MAAGIQLRVEIDFVNGALSTTDTWTDVTADIDGPVSVVSGRSRLADTYQPGTGRLTFHDPTRLYDPSNTAGAHFGQFAARRKIRIQGKRSDDFTYYPIFRGYVDTWEPDFVGPNGEANRTTIHFTDAVPLLKLQQLPESVWYEAISQETGVAAWYRWRDAPGSAVAIDESGNVNNGVYKLTLDNGAGTTWVGNGETTAYDVSRHKKKHVIPYGGDLDVGWDIGAYVAESKWSYTTLAGQLRPATGFMHIPANTISGRDWSFECWAQWSNPWYFSATGTEDRSTAPPGISNLFSIGAATATEDIHILSVHPFNFTSTIDQVRITVVRPTHAWSTLLSFNITRDGLPHYLAMTSTDAGGGQSIYRLYVDGVLRGTSAATTVNAVGAAQLIHIGYATFTGWWNGAVGESVLYSRRILDAEVAAHYAASANPNNNQDTGNRIYDALDRSGWPVAWRTLAVGLGTMAPVDWNSEPAWDYCELVAASDAGYLFIDESGNVVYRNRNYFTGAPYATPQVEFIDTGLQVAGVVQLSETKFTRDLSQLVNYCQIEMPDGQVVVSQDTASQAAYGRRDRVIKSTTALLADASGLAGWVIANRKDPVTTFTEVTTDAMDDDSIDALLSSCLLGNRTTITRAPASGSALSDQLLISSKRWRFNPDLTYSCTVGLDPIPIVTAWV